VSLSHHHDRDLVLLIAAMAACGGVERIPVRVTWPMHGALWDLWQQLARDGLQHRVPFSLTFEPCPQAGRRARAADRALRELRDSGVLRVEGTMGAASLVFAKAPTVHRRWLMTLDLAVAVTVQQAGERWAARLHTWAKNRSIALESSGSTVTSSSLKCRHVEAPGDRTWATSLRLPASGPEASMRLVTR
jgi:hypothetical protein